MGRQRGLTGGRSTRFGRLAGLGLVAVVVAAVLLLWPRSSQASLFDNLHAVVPRQAYRSAQLSGADLERVIREKRLRAVINLKGGSLTEDPTCRRESAICERLGVEYHVVRLRASNLPPPGVMTRLLAILDRAPKPLLFHCEGGADRSGLVAALYLHLYRGVALDRAQERGLTWRYGHFPLLCGREMDHFLDLYRRTAEGRDFRAWLQERYPALHASHQEKARRRSSKAD